jgi:hypothetical protein
VQIYPFQPTGLTVLAAVINSSATVNVPNAGTQKVPQQLLVQNLSTNVCYFAQGATCTIPSAGSPANGIPVQPGVTVVYTVVGGDAVLGAIVSTNCAVAGPSNMTFTPGEGS